MAREIHDHYFHEAKRHGYRSRAAYKLIEIDDRKTILAKGDAVLDCGCAPGSWLQVAARRVGPKGVVVGVDKQPVDSNFREENIVTREGDLTKIPAADLWALTAEAPGPGRRHRGSAASEGAAGGRFDVVLSDMAPFTTGERVIDHHKSVRLAEAVLDLCAELLRGPRAGAKPRPGGNVVIKVFEGEAYRELLQRCRGMFENVKGFKPKASRDESIEIYVICHGYKGAAKVDETTTTDDELPEGFELPKRKPSTGWG